MSAVSAWSNRYGVFMDSDNDEWEAIENVVPKKVHSTKNQKLSNLKAGKPTAKEEEKSKINKTEITEVDKNENNGEERKFPSKDEERVSSANKTGARSPKDERACFKCNEVGHFARDCSNASTAVAANERKPDTGNRGCFNCNEAGHIARNCTKESAPKSFGENPNLKDVDCYKCGETGHMARNCTSATNIRSNENQRNIQEPECYNCNNIGHLARNCPSAKSGRDVKCYQCNEDGHIARNCPSANSINIVTAQKEENEYTADVQLQPECDDSNAVASPDANEIPSVEADEVNYTLDEWKSLQGAKSEPKFNIRKPGEGSEIDPKWKKTTVYKKEKEVYNDDDDEENEVYLQRANRQKKVVDITYKFTDTARGGINGRGRGRGGREGRGGRGYSSAGRTGRGSNGQTPNMLDEHSFPSLG